MRYVSDMTTPKPGRPNTLVGLLDKRREIAGRAEQLAEQLRRACADLEALDDVIRLFDPEVIPGPPKRYMVGEPVLAGEVSRLVRIALRDASGPLTTRQVAIEVAMARGHDQSDAKVVADIKKRVAQSLRRMRKRGWVQEVPQEGEYKGWRLVTARLRT
jgi:hypothetical protein